jgi:hypothetical protein
MISLRLFPIQDLDITLGTLFFLKENKVQYIQEIDNNILNKVLRSKKRKVNRVTIYNELLNLIKRYEFVF